jgi:hypothetical protein
MKKYVKIVFEIFLVVVALLSLFKIDWKNYLPDIQSYLPSSIGDKIAQGIAQSRIKRKQAHVFQLLVENDSLINDLLVISKRSRTEGESHLGYCMGAWMDYQDWFKENKAFIAETPELKEHVQKGLKAVIELFDEYAKQDKNYFFSNLIGLVKACLDELNVGLS